MRESPEGRRPLPREDNILAFNIDRLIKAKHMSLRGIERLTRRDPDRYGGSISYSYLSKVIGSSIVPSEEKIRVLARALNLPPDYFIRHLDLIRTGRELPKTENPEELGQLLEKAYTEGDLAGFAATTSKLLILAHRLWKNPDPSEEMTRSFGRIACLLREMKEYEVTLEIDNLVLRLWEKDDDLRALLFHNKARTHLLSGDIANAEACAHASLAIAAMTSTKIAGRITLAEALMSRGAYEKAEREMQEAEQLLDDQVGDRVRTRYHLTRSFCLAKRRRYNEARDELSAARQLSSKLRSTSLTHFADFCKGILLYEQGMAPRGGNGNSQIFIPPILEAEKQFLLVLDDSKSNGSTERQFLSNFYLWKIAGLREDSGKQVHRLKILKKIRHRITSRTPETEEFDALAMVDTQQGAGENEKTY